MKMSYDSFKVLTFDVVGTLIDFETGVLDAVRKISGRKPAELSDDQIFASYKRGRDAHPERSSRSEERRVGKEWRSRGSVQQVRRESRKQRTTQSIGRATQA